MQEGILSVIGQTPMICLKRIVDDNRFNLYAKLEMLNPGGSAKDRSALKMIRSGIDNGNINSNTVIIESSSGNLAIALAQVCAYYNLKFICVVDSKTTKQNINIIKAYGAEIELVSNPDPETEEFLPSRIKRVRELQEKIHNSYWPNQYSNLENPAAHQHIMEEISQKLNGKVDYLFCAVSTCGTIRGCQEYIASKNMDTQIIAVDAKGSVIFGDKKAKRLIPGHGASIRSALYKNDICNTYVHVTDLDCVIGCHRLVKKESILAGGSSGGIISAMEKYKDKIQDGSNCVVILHDRGERYMDTVYSQEWVKKHFGDVL